ncbi:DUF4105 domain-containing protein [Acetobacter persici]|uniref:Lnb N-terminal periplasmic domain-containing protein n=1 Tax=Acetobacter persici TaxID=1076596 RepID=UPI0036DC0B4D
MAQAPQSSRPTRKAPRRRWASIVAGSATFLLGAFGTPALYYSTLEPDAVRLGLTALFPVLLGTAFILRARQSARLALAGVSAAFAVWYVTDPPRNNRDWAGEYALPATVSIDGRMVHLHHIRNFLYKTPSDYTPRYYDADYALDNLSSLDLVTSYWAGESIAHVFLSFGFRDGRHVAMSIETRRQKKFPYSAIAGFFHHYELFYVVADERDLIGVRTDIRKERVYLYRVLLSAQARERLFRSYLEEVDHLSHTPEWYNTLTSNCTTGILTRAQASFRYRLDWRVLLSGYTASLAYRLGLLDTHLDFRTLHERSRIHRPDGATPGPDYSSEIRQTLPMETDPAASR